MSDQFRAIPSPSNTLLEVLSKTDPANPFLTPAFVAYRKAAGYETTTWALTIEHEGEFLTGCVGYLQISRLPWLKQLEIHSLAKLPGETSKLFWDGVKSLCRQQKIGKLLLQTFGSCLPVVMPNYPNRFWHRKRCEYVLNVESYDGTKSLSSNHRRNVSRAERAGVEIVEASHLAASNVHASLMGLSMQRRLHRGEVTAYNDATGPTHRLIASGAARIYQAVLDDAVLSSILVLRAQNGAYYHSAGTSPEGMRIGASHLLVMQLVQRLKEEGLVVFNLGGADNEGLARFKAGFGAMAVKLEATAYYTGNLLSRRINILADELRRFR